MNVSETVTPFLTAAVAWARAQPDILALALVGSYARGAARSDSDIDLVIISTGTGQYTADLSWVARFGEIVRHQIENYGKVTSLRVWYRNGLEVEYGFTDEDWAATPLDDGTRQVISEGMKVLYERGNILSRHQAASS